jgi:hypothetical protein
VFSRGYRLALGNEYSKLPGNYPGRKTSNNNDQEFTPVPPPLGGVGKANFSVTLFVLRTDLLSIGSVTILIDPGPLLIAIRNSGPGQVAF